ncbi:hypothetical protein SCARD494_09696 [Seiridium cardinale]
MANGAHSRRVACKLCRDRKVKCGGEQPQCQKCIRAGERCVYLPTQKPTKADLAQTVEALQKRVEEAEAYISRLNASAGDTVTPPCSNNSDSATNSGPQTSPPTIVQMSSTVNRREGFGALPNESNQLDLLYQQHNLQLSGSELPDPSIWQSLERPVTVAPFSVNEDMNLDTVDFDFHPQSGFDCHRDVNEETGATILGPVAAFSSAVFRNQAEASVMGSLIADYIAWLRKVPPGGGAPVNEESHYVAILETLETRVRELCDTTQSRTRSALQELVTALEEIAPPGSAMATRLASLEDELLKEAQERSELFRSRYNICALLKEQAHNIPP